MSSRACVIYNPVAGRGHAARVVESAVRESPDPITLMPTTHPGHAEELAADAVLQGFTRIIAAGGDGTVHEVANGMLRVMPHEAALSVWPLGSGNDYAFATGLLTGWKPEYRYLPRRTELVDVGRITGGRKLRYFVNGMGLGFNAAVTLESRKISFLRGMALYGTAIMRAMIWHWVAPMMRIAFDATIVESPTFGLTINVGQREGAFPLTPKASLTDGLFDCIHTNRLSRIGLMRLSGAMTTGNIPQPHPHVTTHRCQSVEIQASVPVRVHLDGEFFCQPEEGITNLRVETLPGHLRVERFDPPAIG
ncbi:diacylglycerol/lipid kinase family protein [Tuwongella immobilis]|uniref:DAGKc domain-containing protein n=1 Tax=Tuwongella immobilis TaxID=692036 RepID=A0A6C2YSA0_9BACT|nr:diacylglycerol kinase family protein [Tuwongella immobilis]VIP03855.1 diacylglycerol kinase catalytic region : Diacylglycerol kinase catalytic region OS=Chloroflexus aurantiacus (strain ATCC 29364 / DSM 637 / Y-400-fl) GN=Chy400_2923 PE=4 SV=1: DAGK_cat [Tuwongella immobilis]VTS05077.1 diacylglycerol kinase catalytic region : Diacylglycerol kinase catalytic region OS=Chloroflexus aurantiacus (strain ATCC 29364 / DSM 637 / Y-400-fl) GN=Chy400_2923 PE=4 SV=1: DAGK_cat [Tuwongella immobilis]